MQQYSNRTSLTNIPHRRFVVSPGDYNITAIYNIRPCSYLSSLVCLANFFPQHSPTLMVLPGSYSISIFNLLLFYFIRFLFLGNSVMFFFFMLSSKLFLFLVFSSTVDKFVVCFSEGKNWCPDFQVYCQSVSQLTL